MSLAITDRVANQLAKDLAITPDKKTREKIRAWADKFLAPTVLDAVDVDTAFREEYKRHQDAAQELAAEKPTKAKQMRTAAAALIPLHASLFPGKNGLA